MIFRQLMILGGIDYLIGAADRKRLRHYYSTPLRDVELAFTTVRIIAASSTGRRNTGIKSICWGFKSQGLSRSFVELTCHSVQMGLRVH